MPHTLPGSGTLAVPCTPGDDMLIQQQLLQAHHRQFLALHAKLTRPRQAGHPSRFMETPLFPTRFSGLGSSSCLKCPGSPTPPTKALLSIQRLKAASYRKSPWISPCFFDMVSLFQTSQGPNLFPTFSFGHSPLCPQIVRSLRAGLRHSSLGLPLSSGSIVW